LVYSPERQFFNLIPKHIVPLYRLGTCQINEMETVVRDWLRMQESAFCLKGMCKPGRGGTNAWFCWRYSASHLTACGWKQCGCLRRHWTLVLALLNGVVSAGQVI